MGKDETIFRVVKGKENPYAQTDKLLLRDYRLDFGTRGLLTMLLSMPDDWDVRFKHLINASPAGKTALRRLIKDAIRHGYMHRERVNGGGHGKFKWVTLVFESPDLNPYFDPDADPTVGAQPSTGFQPMAPSTGFPSMENQPMAPLTGFPSMENRHIYRYLYVLRAENGKTKNGNDLIFDDDGALLDNPSFFSVFENGTVDQIARANRESAQLVASWCSAMVLDWLPAWNGGERFADGLDDDRVHVLATWLWSYIEINDGSGYGMETRYFRQRNGEPFKGVDNAVGKIIAQVRLGNAASLTDYDMANCATAILKWSDAAAVLLDSGGVDEGDAGMPW